jgi:hypothetical protein
MCKALGLSPAPKKEKTINKQINKLAFGPSSRGLRGGGQIMR